VQLSTCTIASSHKHAIHVHVATCTAVFWVSTLQLLDSACPCLLESAGAGPQSARAGPESARAGPESARAGPESARVGPESAGAGPESARAGPESARTGPESDMDSTC